MKKKVGQMDEWGNYGNLNLKIDSMKKEVTNVYQYIMTFTSVLKKRKSWRYIYGKFKLNANTNSNLLHILITKKHWNRVFISVY